jgi:hypothetical protein
MSELDHHCLALALNDLRNLPTEKRLRALRQFCAIDERAGPTAMAGTVLLGRINLCKPPDLIGSRTWFWSF